MQVHPLYLIKNIESLPGGIFMSEKFHEIVVTNPTLGKVNNTKVYLTDDLYERFEQETTSDGTQLLKLFEGGRALKGFKHLLEQIHDKNSKHKLVLTLGQTRKEDNEYYINYDEYRKDGGKKFYSLYRITGLEVSSSFLASHFPDDFSYHDKPTISETAKQVEDNFPQIIEKFTRKKKNQLAIIKKTSSIVEELRSKKRLIKSEIDHLEELRRQSSISFYMDKLKEFNERLGKKYPETKGPYSWQKWIYKNNWLFGVQYGIPIDRGKVGFDSIPDFLYPTLDGFLDILEIKLPSHQVIRKDESHPGSYVWSSKANEAIGQVVNYTHEMELNQLQLSKRINEEYGDQLGFNIYTLKPRSFILIGRSDTWKSPMKEGLRKLNFSLHAIEVITYDELHARGQSIVEMYIKVP